MVQWAVSICICSVVVCIVEMLLSDTALEKTVRLVLGAFMLCAVMVPLGSMAVEMGEWEETGELSTDIPESVAEQRREFLEQELAKLADKTLEEEQITAEAIRIRMDIDKDNCITMITAEVTVAPSQVRYMGKIRELLREKLGMECQVKREGEDESR